MQYHQVTSVGCPRVVSSHPSGPHRKCCHCPCGRLNRDPWEETLSSTSASLTGGRPGWRWCDFPCRPSSSQQTAAKGGIRTKRGLSRRPNRGPQQGPTQGERAAWAPSCALGLLKTIRSQQQVNPTPYLEFRVRQAATTHREEVHGEQMTALSRIIRVSAGSPEGGN